MGIFIFTIMGGIFVVVGLMFILGSLWGRWLHGKMSADCTAYTIGKLERFTRGVGFKDTSPLKSYYPVFVYTVNGQRYECTGGFGTANIETFSVKNKVIFYNPNNPALSYTDPKVFTLVTTLFFWLGIGLTLVGLLLIILNNV